VNEAIAKVLSGESGQLVAEQLKEYE